MTASPTHREAPSGTDVAWLRRRYADDGFCVTGPLFPADAIDRALVAGGAVAVGESDTGMAPRLREREREPEDGPPRLIKIAEPHNASHALRALFALSEPWELIADVLEARMLQVWAVDLFVKRPEPSARGNIGWHQDGPYAPHWRGDVFTVWIALSDVSADTSPLRYLKGSHRLGPLGKADIFRTDLDMATAALGLPAGFEPEQVAVGVPSGGVAIHHRDTLHASGPNLSRRPRVSLAVRMRTDRCKLISSGAQVAHLDDPALAPVVFDGQRR